MGFYITFTLDQRKVLVRLHATLSNFLHFCRGRAYRLYAKICILSVLYGGGGAFPLSPFYSWLSAKQIRTNVHYRR